MRADVIRYFLQYFFRMAAVKLVITGAGFQLDLPGLEAALTTADVYREPVPLAFGDDLAAWDAWLAGRLTVAELGAKPFTPLPVLGVPGWWPVNEDAAYYADAGVFRPGRMLA